MRNIELRAAVRSRTMSAITALCLGAILGAALQFTERFARASQSECASLYLRHELQSFQRVDGTGETQEEQALWPALATLITVDPTLELEKSDDDPAPEFLQLRRSQ